MTKKWKLNNKMISLIKETHCWLNRKTTVFIFNESVAIKTKSEKNSDKVDNIQNIVEE